MYYTESLFISEFEEPDSDPPSVELRERSGVETEAAELVSLKDSRDTKSENISDRESTDGTEVILCVESIWSNC